jgi:hypothetical protein
MVPHLPSASPTAPRVTPRMINANRRLRTSAARGPHQDVVVGTTHGVWKCGNPQNGFPHFHNATSKVILTVEGRFIEGSKTRSAAVGQPAARRCRARPSPEHRDESARPPMRSHLPVSGLGQPATSWPAPVSTLRGPLRLRDSVIDGICLTTPFWDSPQDFTDALRMTSPTAIFATTSMPLMTRPKTTYFPSRRGTALSVT